MKNSINYLPIVLLMLLLPVMAWAQSSSYMLDPSSSLVVKGTSTIHDWEVNAEQMDVSIRLAAAQPEGNALKNPVESFSLTVPVESLESGKGKMNRKMHDALKKDDYPQITFELKSAELTGANTSAKSFTLRSAGTLTIAGNAKEVTFSVKATRVDENSFRFEGSYSLNMKEYEVDPPSAMLGTIRTGEEVEIAFNILVK